MLTRTNPLGESRIGRSRVVQRVGWGLADQTLSSLTNFALGILVARSVAPAEFGAFSLAYTTYLIAIGTSRAVNSESFVVRFSATSEQQWRAGAALVTGAALFVGLVAAAASLTLGLIVGGSSRSVFFVLALVLPAILLQDSWRIAFVAQGRSSLAFMTDLVWALALVPAIAFALSRPTRTAATFVLAWGVAGTIAAVAALRQGRTPPLVHRTFSWWWQQRDMCFRYLGEYVATNGGFQLSTYVVAGVAGLAAAGSLRGAFLLLGPVILLFQGSRLVFVPEGVRLLKRSPHYLRRAVVLLALVLAAGSLAWGAIILLLPAATGRALLGQSWRGARHLILPMAIVLAGSGAEAALVIGLRSLAAPKRSFAARMIEGALTAASGAVGAVLGGAVGAAWALAVAFWIEVGIWWWQFSAGLREYHPGDQPGVASAGDVAPMPVGP